MHSIDRWCCFKPSTSCFTRCWETRTSQSVSIQVAAILHSRFTVGIGSGVDKKLVEDLAEAGNGKCEIVMNNERLQTKVMRLLRCALIPVIEGSDGM